jgi:hypothetical protein
VRQTVFGEETAGSFCVKGNAVAEAWIVCDHEIYAQGSIEAKSYNSNNSAGEEGIPEWIGRDLFFYEDEDKQDGPYLDTDKVERFIYEGKSLLR